MKITSETLDMILGALAEQLWSLGAQLEIVVIGGSALTALGLVRRATRDVDLLAISENGELRPADPLPEALRTARDRVARDFELDENWLNAGPTDLLKWGLPAGFMTRVVARRYGRHEADLRELHPSAAELIAAMVLVEALSALGVEDADLGA